MCDLVLFLCKLQLGLLTIYYGVDTDPHGDGDRTTRSGGICMEDGARRLPRKKLVKPGSCQGERVRKAPQRTPKAKFDETHVRWTGYLTKSNDVHLRRLLDKRYIPSMTRFINDAVAERLKTEFNISSGFAD